MNGIGGNILLDINSILKHAQIKHKMRVADLGCGMQGHFIFPLAQMVGDEGVVYAVDILKTVLENLSRRAEFDNVHQIKTIWSDLEIFGATKIESSSLDIALLVNTLFQSRKRKEIVREAARILKKNARLVIADWKSIATPLGPALEDRLNAENLKIALNRLGFRLEEEFEAGPYHFGMVFKKL